MFIIGLGDRCYFRQIVATQDCRNAIRSPISGCQGAAGVRGWMEGSAHVIDYVLSTPIQPQLREERDRELDRLKSDIHWQGLDLEQRAGRGQERWKRFCEGALKCAHTHSHTHLRSIRSLRVSLSGGRGVKNIFFSARWPSRGIDALSFREAPENSPADRAQHCISGTLLV